MSARVGVEIAPDALSAARLSRLSRESFPSPPPPTRLAFLASSEFFPQFGTQPLPLFPLLGFFGPFAFFSFFSSSLSSLSSLSFRSFLLRRTSFLSLLPRAVRGTLARKRDLRSSRQRQSTEEARPRRMGPRASALVSTFLQSLLYPKATHSTAAPNTEGINYNFHKALQMWRFWGSRGSLPRHLPWSIAG